MYRYPKEVMLYASKDSSNLAKKEDICCEECYFPPRRYVLADRPAAGDRSPGPETTIKVKVEADTDDLLRKVAEITALVEKCNDMTKEARKALDEAYPRQPTFPPAPRSIP